MYFIFLKLALWFYIYISYMWGSLTLILWTDFPSSRPWLHTVMFPLLWVKLQPSSHKHSALKLANARSSGMFTLCPDMARYWEDVGAEEGV